MDRCWSLLLVFTLASVTAFADDSTQLITIDLAEAETSGTITVEAGWVEVVLLSCLPAGVYSPRWVIDRKPIDALPLPSSQFDTSQPSGFAGDECDSLNNAVDALVQSKSETDVPVKLRAIGDARAGCTQSAANLRADQVVAATQRRIRIPRKLARGYEATLIVVRVSDGEARSWSQTITTNPAGRWLISFGFNFIDDDDESYTTQPTDHAPDQFVITPDANRDEYDYRPAIFFTWIPSSWDRSVASYGLSGGIDFGQDSVAVFLGGTTYIGDNLQLSIGGAMREVTRLRGEYEPYQVVSSPLASDQLLKDTYQPGWFIGLGFRFSENPFSTNRE